MFDSSEANAVYDAAQRESNKKISEGEQEASKLLNSIPIEIIGLKNLLNNELRVLNAEAVGKKDIFAKDYDRMISSMRKDYQNRINLISSQKDFSTDQKSRRSAELRAAMEAAIKDLQNKKNLKLAQIETDLKHSVLVRNQRFSERKFNLESKIKAQSANIRYNSLALAKSILDRGRSEAEQIDDEWRSNRK